MARWKKKQEQPKRRQLSEERIAREERQSALGSSLFRRNRTLTGSSSGAVSSATELTGDFKSPRAQSHHLVAHRRRLGWLFTIALIGVLFFTWLLYEFTASVRITPSDSSVVLQEGRYEKILDEYYSVRPIERLRILLNSEQLNDYVKRKAPEVASLEVTGAAGVGTSQFILTPRAPIAGWLIDTKQYFVDNDGIAFQINYFSQPAVKVVDQSGVPQTAGTTVASSRFLRFVGRSVAVAADYGMKVEKAVIPVGTTRQIELQITGYTYPAKLSLDRPVGEQVEDMQRALSYLASKKMAPRYIDVRVSGKAFYQ